MPGCRQGRRFYLAALHFPLLFPRNRSHAVFHTLSPGKAHEHLPSHLVVPFKILKNHIKNTFFKYLQVMSNWLSSANPSSNGSPIFCNELSMLDMCRYLMPCFLKCSRTPSFYIARYIPPFPFGFFAIFPFLKIMILPVSFSSDGSESY